jgi:hypothetical protein
MRVRLGAGVKPTRRSAYQMAIISISEPSPDWQNAAPYAAPDHSLARRTEAKLGNPLI